MQLAVCDSPAGRLGLTVCYDLRFPDMYQRLAFERGAEVLLVPSAFTRATGGCRFPPMSLTKRDACMRLSMELSMHQKNSSNAYLHIPPERGSALGLEYC